MTGELGLGPRSREWLASVGVRTLDDLAALGALEAWRRTRLAHPGRVSLNLLYALEGLLLGCAWNDLPPGVRDRLRREAGSAGSEPRA